MDRDSRVGDDISLADARAWVEAAIEAGRCRLPAAGGDRAWPTCRALVGWITRGLPDGGTGYQRQQWDQRPSAGSRIGSLPRSTEPGSTIPITADCWSTLWYGTDYGSGDPLRWEPGEDRDPARRLIPEGWGLAKAPDLLRAFIPFAHAEVGLSEPDRREQLAAIDDWEPRTSRRSAHHGRRCTLLAALGIDTEDMTEMRVGADGPERASSGRCSGGSRWTSETQVGLDGLDDDPLPE